MGVPEKTKKAVVFGTGKFAEVVDFYLGVDSNYDVVAFTATEGGGSFRGKPIIAFDAFTDFYPPDSYSLFVAVGYTKLNVLRQRFCEEARSKGYTLLSYISSRATEWESSTVGDNVFIFEDNTIQPFVTIGDGVVLWSGNHVGHHASIGSYTFVSSHVVISGQCKIGNNCFIGVNATIADGVVIGDRNLIGAGALIEKATGQDEAYFAQRTVKFSRSATWFFK